VGKWAVEVVWPRDRAVGSGCSLHSMDGEDDVARSLLATVTSSGHVLGPFSVTASLIVKGRRPAAVRVRVSNPAPGSSSPSEAVAVKGL
jgi:hypothetical protein